MAAAVAADAVAGVLDAHVLDAAFAARAAAAVAVDAYSELAGVTLVALDAGAGIEAASEPADLAVGAGHVVAAVDAVTVGADLALRALDVDTGGIHAGALIATDQRGEATELTGATARHTFAAVANMILGADLLALVGLTVAIIIQRVADLVRWRGIGHAGELALLALHG